MKVVIIEDERPAVEHLERALAAYDPSIEVVATLDSVEASVRWFAKHAAPDLVLCDIQLADGLALSIFEQVKVRCPVVFCTAYDQYWTEAFAAGGIDYVLKPIEQARLGKALAKYRDLREHFAGRLEALLAEVSRPAPSGWKRRFLVKRGLDVVWRHLLAVGEHNDVLQPPDDAHVLAHELRLVAELLRPRLPLGEPQVEDDDVRSLGDEPGRRGVAEARGPAGDDRGRTGQLHGGLQADRVRADGPAVRVLDGVAAQPRRSRLRARFAGATRTRFADDVRARQALPRASRKRSRPSSRSTMRSG